MNCKEFRWLGTALAVLLLSVGCQSPGEREQEAEREKALLEAGRKRYFQDARGKMTPMPESVNAELLKSTTELLPQSKRENPYPIYTAPPPLPPETAPSPALPIALSDSGKIRAELNFQQASLADVTAVFAELLKFSYHLDGKLNGTVTLALNDELTRRELWELFTRILAVSHVALHQENQVFFLQPLEQTARTAPADAVFSSIDTALFLLKNIDAKSTAAQIAPFLTPGVRPLELESRNSLLVVDTRSNLEKVRQIIAQLDRPLRQGWAKMVIPCRNVSAKRLAAEAAEVLPVIGFPVSLNSDKPRPEEIQLIAVERLELLVASAANQEALEELGRWVGILDRDESGDRERMFIYNIMNSNAEELVKALSVMFPVEGVTMSAAGKSDAAAGGAAASASTVGAAGAGSRNSKNSSAVDGPANVFEIPVKVFADAVNNRLLIRTTPRAYATIKALLGRIDTIPAQVLLQVLVVDVALNDSIKFGVEFMMQGGGGNVESVGGTNYTGLTPGIGQKAPSGGQFWIYNPNNPNEKYGYINALAGKTNVKVISSPQLLITSHNEAKISVGSKVPIVNSEITNTQSIITDQSDSSTNLVRNIQYQDTGVILKITPHVTRGGRVAVELAQTVSEADANTISGIDSPIIKEQIIETVMSIRDGQTIICGGIIREKSSDNLSTLPLIGGVPFLRRLVGDTDTSTERTEMMILISGYIITEETKLETLLARYDQAVDSLVEFHLPPEERKRKIDSRKGLLETWFIE